MTAQTERLRQRAKKPKVRTGCRTCKSRRVKCDEDRPACLRCRTSGRTCGGYEINRNVQRHAAPQVVAIAPKFKPEITLPPTSSFGLGHEEAANFDYFRMKTLLSLGSFNRYSLWESLIIEICFREPAVLNAAVAVGSTHRSFEKRRWKEGASDDLDLQKRISQDHYLMAITSLRTKLANDSDPGKHEIALMTCFLFICLELIQSEIPSAINHLRTGLRILCELKGRSEYDKDKSTIVSTSNNPETLLDFLTIFFARLDYQSTMFGETVPRVIAIPSSNASDSALWIPLTFCNVAEARQYLDAISSAVFAFRGKTVHNLTCSPFVMACDKSLKHRWARTMYKHPDFKELNPKLLERQAELEERMSAWEKTFQKLVSKNQRFFSIDDSRASKLAHNNWLAIRILLKEALTTRQTCFDQYIEEFRQIVALSENFSMAKDAALPSFSTDMGCFGALYYVVAKCRDSAIRHKAVSLLLQSPRREGMWDGHVIGQFARQIVAIEEFGLRSDNTFLTCDEVPEASRFSDITIGFSKDGNRGRLYLGRFRHESDAQWFVREVEFEFVKDPMVVKTLDIIPAIPADDAMDIGLTASEGSPSRRPSFLYPQVIEPKSPNFRRIAPVFTLPDEEAMERLNKQYEDTAANTIDDMMQLSTSTEDTALIQASPMEAVW